MGVLTVEPGNGGLDRSNVRQLVRSSMHLAENNKKTHRPSWDRWASWKSRGGEISGGGRMRPHLGPQCEIPVGQHQQRKTREAACDCAFCC